MHRVSPELQGCVDASSNLSDMLHRSLFALTALALLAPAPARASYPDATLLFSFTDPQITESSGLVRSSLDDEVLFTHNDSGDNGNLGRFFAVGPQGQTLTEFALTPSINGDWEDMAAGPGADGGPALFFADIGDNYEFRTTVQIYEVAEPVIEQGSAFSESRPSRVHLITFEDGPHNAETFLVDPRDGSFAIVTKDADGKSGLYVADPIAVAGAPRLLRRVADIDFAALASDASGAGRSSTGGDIAPDRSRLVVRTYLEAFEWPLGEASLADAVRADPTRIPLPPTRQGEAITYSNDGSALLTSSEGRFAPVHMLRSHT